MKNTFVIIISIMFIAAASCNGKTEKDAEKNMNGTENTTKENQNTPAVSASIPAGMENILGEWKMDRRLRDDNGNHIIDGDEEKTAINPGGYMKFNADGTCKFETVMDGTYEITTEADGRKRLSIKDLSGTQYPMSQFIISVNPNELTIDLIGGFDIYKRP